MRTSFPLYLSQKDQLLLLSSHSQLLQFYLEQVPDYLKYKSKFLAPGETLPPRRIANTGAK